MVKPKPKPKTHAKDSSSSPRNSFAAAFSSIIKQSISVVVPKSDKSSKPTALSTAPIIPTATRNSTLASKSSPPSIAPAGVSGSSVTVHSPQSSTPANSNTVAIASDIFSTNTSKIKQDILLPKAGEDMETTAQLVACAELLAQTTTGASDLALISKNMLTDSQIKWKQEMDDRPFERKYIQQQLMNQMVDRFIVLPSKPSEAIREIILLGPVLDKEHYQFLLNRFLGELNSELTFNPNLLEGLVALVECAPDYHLKSDDLIRVLRVVRHHLRESALQDTSNIIQLTVAISKVLMIMVDCGVKDLNREQEHKPLLEVLSKYRSHSDPLVRYQVEYAYRALQLVPDDETMTQKFTRSGFGLAGGLIKVGVAFKLDFGSVPDGVPEVIENGRELAESLKTCFGFGDKNPWLLSVHLAEVMVSEGRLVDFNHLICKDDCRLDPFFQWGVCLILGEMAVEPLWDANTREKAIRLLGEIFKSNPGSEKHRDVRRWILTLLHNISELPGIDPSTNLDNNAVKQQVPILLQVLNDVGGERLFPFRHSHPVMNRRRLETQSKLLNDDSNTPDLELLIERLRCQRQEEYNRHSVYVLPMSTSTLQVSDEAPYPLHGRVHQFLAGKGLVMLILGDSGAGKSTFNSRLEQELWNDYKAGDPIPLFIDLKAIRDPEQSVIQQHLDSPSIFSTQMKKLSSREFIVICDGYDEIQSKPNLYTNIRINSRYQWRAKMIISCRTQYLTPEYRIYLAPQQDAIAHVGLSPIEIFTEAVICPFNIDQIKEYIEQYTAIPEVNVDSPRWSAEQYLERLQKITHIMDLIKNPFMLSMVLQILPKIAPATTQITRVELYDKFVELHYKNEKERLIKQKHKMSSALLAVFKEIEELDFIEHGIDFSRNLAKAIYAEGKGVNKVDYWSIADRKSWKRLFFGPDPEIQLLREASQLIRRTSAPDSQGQIKGRSSAASRNAFSFSHMSLLEYFYALSIYDPSENLPQLDSSGSQSLTANSHSLPDHPLGQQSLVDLPAILQFLADRVRHRVDFKDHLHELVQLSRSDKADTSISRAASNAITILIRAGERFNGADLRGIQVPGADLSCGDFDSAQLQGADLRKTVLRNVWLHQADLSDSLMEGAMFGQYPYLEVEESVRHCVFSPDGRWLTTSLDDGTIITYDTSTWTKVNLSKHTVGITSVVHSPNGHQIASGGDDKTVGLWDARTGALASSLIGHAGAVVSVKFSPNGHQIASGSWDETVRLWDAQTGALIDTLIGHTAWVTSVAYSPSGHQIASGSDDKTVRLWDAQTGALASSLSGHTEAVTSVTYSHSGRVVVSGSDDKTVRLWDTQTGALANSLSGHTGAVTSLAYSPTAHLIASGSDDKTVRLWDAQTGALVNSLSGHTGSVTSVAYSPSGHQIASGSWDRTVRLWDAQAGAFTSSLSGHTGPVVSVACSSSAQHIASGGYDRTVRLWDAQTGALVNSLSGHTGTVTSVTYSPSGLHIASGSRDETVRLWDAQTGDLVNSLSGHTAFVTSVAYSPSGHQIASGSWDRTVRLWDVQTGDLVNSLSGHTATVTSVVYSPSGHQIASGSRDRTVRLWDTQTGALSSSLSGHTATVTSVAYSPSSAHRIASGSDDKTVRLWDTLTGALANSLSGHTASVTSVAFSPSGHWIASGSRDETVRLWDIHSGQCLAILGGFQDIVNSIAWKATVESIYLVVGGRNKSVRMWSVVGEVNEVRMCLHWRSTPDTLVLSKASIQGVRSLSEMNVQLFRQQGVAYWPITL